MLLPVLFASLALLQQTPPAAPAPAAAPTVTADAETAATLPPVTVDGDRREPAQTCRTEAVTGSRFGRRVCRNTVQTAEEAAESREMLRRMQGARMPDGG